MPACFSMLFSVPIGISRTGCGTVTRRTVTRPVFTGCLNCLWLPICATSYQPSCFKRCMTSRLDIRYDTHFLHTHQVGVYKACSNGLLRSRNSAYNLAFTKLLLRTLNWWHFSTGGISDVAFTKIVLHHRGPRLRDRKVRTNVVHHFLCVHGTDTAECVGFHILVQQFIRIQLRTV
jgi:hypothetical protein